MTQKIKSQSILRDPAHDIWRLGSHALDAFFKPNSVAIIGATEKPHSVGFTLTNNLVSLFKGKVYPVNPKRTAVCGVPAYQSIAGIPEKPDLAVIVTPSQTVPDLIAECAAAGIRSAIIISAGFKELGAPGAELERQVLKAARGRVRIIGPNCLGVMNPHMQFNATFADRMAKPGSVAFLSQSGALCTAILDWSFGARVGFSSFVSLGSMLDVNWGDLIDYLGNDPKTKSILIYMESVGDARSFMSAAREVSLCKPIIILKAGRTEAAAKAAASHTGSLAGSDEVLNAAFERAGVIRVKNIGELFHLANILAKQLRPRGPRLSILTNAGGPGVLATDSLIEGGGKLAELSPSTISSLDKLLPPHWSHGNPVDILGDAGPERYAQATEILAGDETTDALLVILTPQSMTDPAKTAELLSERLKSNQKPVLASWMGGVETSKGIPFLTKAGIPVSDYPDQAAQMFNYMWKYQHGLDLLYQTPASSGNLDSALRLDTANLIRLIQESGRNVLTEDEAKKILTHYGIPAVETIIAHDENETVKIAEHIGYPVVLKLFSLTITHKTDVGGVRLNLQTAEETRAAFKAIRSSVVSLKGEDSFQGVSVQRMIDRNGYELLLGSSADPQFGPVIAFGAGGQLVEVMKDYALALPPLNATLARQLIEKTRIFKALTGVRGQPSVNLEKLSDILVKFSRLVLEHPRIREIDINPLLVSGEEMIALDARIVLHEQNMPDNKLPRPAIRPYPSEYIYRWTTKNGLSVVIRPIRPEDEPSLVNFHRALSEKTVRRRYFKSIGLTERVAHDRLSRVCYNDYDRQIALVVESQESKNEILAVARLTKTQGDAAKFSMIVNDQNQNQGIGEKLLSLVTDIAKKEGVATVAAEMLMDNIVMRKIFEKLNFAIIGESDDKVIFSLDLARS